MLSPYTLAGGLTTLLVFTLHGALFISLKTEGALAQRAGSLAGKLGVLALAVFLLLILLTYIYTDLFGKSGAAAVLLGAAGCLALTWFLLRSGKNGWAFAVNGLTIVLFTVSIFWGLFPRVMVSSLRPDWSLTIYNASSSHYTLQVMTVVALVMVPVVLLYQGWTYWVFRRRVTVKDLHY